MVSAFYDWLRPLFWASSSPDKTTATSASSNLNSKAASAAKPALAASVSPDSSPIRDNKPRTVTHIPELDKVQIEAKKLEWKISLQAILRAYDTLDDANDCVATPLEYLNKRATSVFLYLHSLASAISADDRMACQTKAEKLVSELTKDVPHLTKNKVADILRPYFSELRLEKHTVLLDQHATELYEELSCCFATSTAFADEYELLKKDIDELSLLLEESHAYLESDPASRYQVILMVLRRALKRPAYLLMRTDESNHCVHLLHSVVIASIAESETLTAYLMLGKAICDRAKPSIERVESLGDILITARETAAESGFPENDPLVNKWRISKAAEFLANSIIKAIAAGYGLLPNDKEVRAWRITKSLETMASAVSKITDVIELVINYMHAGISVAQIDQAVINRLRESFFDDAKDYRGAHGNLFSVASDEKFKGPDNASVTDRVLLGPSLAQGSKIHPEFLALLQALENRRISQVPIDEHSFAFWSYTNLQTRDDGLEGKQTDAIMRLNERYPFSFDAITLDVDPLPNCTVLDEGVKEKMLSNLMADESFTLDKTGNKSNYYFSPCDKELWTSVFKTIVDKAYDFVLQQNEIDVVNKVAVFCDVVHLGIIRYRAAHLISAFMRANENRKVLTSHFCRVTVDRGMMVNMELLYLQSFRAYATAAIDLGRGILAKNRLPLEKRVSQIGILAHDKSASTGLAKLLNEIQTLAFEDKEIYSAGISYPGCPSNELPKDPVASGEIPQATPSDSRKRKRLTFDHNDPALQDEFE